MSVFSVAEKKFGNVVEKIRDPESGLFRSVRVVDYSLIALQTVITVGATAFADAFEFVRVGTVDDTLQAREVAEASAMARRNEKKKKAVSTAMEDRSRTAIVRR